ncbi:MAG: hypothetical protein ABJA75_09820, partial [Bradyrhizobium sp.]
MTRQAISPRFAIRIRLNMFFLLELWAGFLTRNVTCGNAGNKPVVQQKSTEATVSWRSPGRSARGRQFSPPFQPE